MIPVYTHRITIERPADQTDSDPWEAPSGTPTTVAEHVRAVISVPGGRGAGTAGTEGDSEVVEFVLLADPCDLNYLDVVIDESTGTRYAVRWAVPSPGLAGLASVRAGLTTYRGLGQEESEA